VAILEKIMEVKTFKIKGLKLFQPRVFKDDRGYFFESFNKPFFKENIDEVDFMQDNQSSSSKNVLRGLHFQKPPFDQGKLVRVIQGKVLDVAVDIRKNSPTYGQHEIVELNGEENQVFWVPSGFAHGFVALEEDTIFSYKCTNIYNYDSEDALLWNDTDLNIDWGVQSPLVSDKDKIAQKFKNFETPFKF
jgi:dTDP-4-dehydrorhamnose 3,5-epimerase